MVATYYSGSSVNAYLNGNYLDELCEIQWDYNVPKLPLYGYGDVHFRKTAIGKGIVSGYLMINYVRAGFLYKYLNNKRHIETLQAANRRRQDLATLNSDQTLELLLDTMRGSAEEGRSLVQAVSVRRSRIGRRGASLSPIARHRQVIQDLEDIRKINTLEFNDSAVSEDAFEKTQDPTSTGVDLVLEFGDMRNGSNRKIIEKVHFTSESLHNITSTVGQGAGEPLVEIYQFIARRVV